MASRGLGSVPCSPTVAFAEGPSVFWGSLWLQIVIAIPQSQGAQRLKAYFEVPVD